MLRNNKAITVLLAIAAVAVWTSVAWRIVESPRSSKGGRDYSAQLNTKDFNDSTDFVLDLNFDDPFHIHVNPQRKAPALQPQTPSKRIIRSPITTSDVFYLGLLTSASGKRNALVKYRSKYYYADANDTIGPFLVKRVYADSIIFVSGSRVFKTLRRRESLRQ